MYLLFIKEMGMVEYMYNLLPQAAILGDTSLGLSRMYKVCTMEATIHSNSFITDAEDEENISFDIPTDKLGWIHPKEGCLF